MERFSNRRAWLGGGALAAVVIMALSWFTLIGPGLASAHDLEQDASSTQQKNDASSAKAASLRAKSAHVSTYASALRTALVAVPYSDGLPAFTRQVNAQASAHRVRLTGVTVGGVTPVSSSPSTSGTATGGERSTSAAGGLFSVQVTLQSTGALQDQLAFLTDIRTIGPRRAMVTSTQVTAGGSSDHASVDANASVTAQVTIFAAPRTPQQVKQLKKLLAGDLRG